MLRELRELTEGAHAVVVLTVNAGLTMLYLKIGDRISREVLSEKRGDYGKEIIATLSQQLSQDHGNLDILAIFKNSKNTWHADLMI